MLGKKGGQSRERRLCRVKEMEKQEDKIYRRRSEDDKARRRDKGRQLTGRGRRKKK